MRKDKNFNVTDRISVEIEKDIKINNALKKFKEYICSEILAADINVFDVLENADMIDVNDRLIKVNVNRQT